MPSQQEIAKAFAMFDRNGDGLLSLDELKVILCRPTPGRSPLSEAKVEEIVEKCDTNDDGQLSMEELAAGWADLGIGALLAGVGAADHQAPPPSFAKLIAAGTVVPDEHRGPYALGSYHANVSGAHRGYKAQESYDEWFTTNKAIMARQKVCRRVLNGPIVAEDTYCLEVIGKELRGEGEVNAKGEKEGRGTLVYDDGDMYEGQWLAGHFHGQGKMTYATGSVYKGAWVQDKKHGYGKYSSAQGDAYEGEFQASLYHGRGKLTHPDGSSYDGEWAEGKRQGRGKVTNGAGSSYDGEWADSEQHGSGTYTWDDGEVDVGCYEAGAEVGQGVRWSECGPGGGVGAAGRRGGAQHPAGRAKIGMSSDEDRFELGWPVRRVSPLGRRRT